MPGLEPRDFQLRAAAAAIRGRDIFVVESAGAGKTLAAWFAALILGGVTLFISPLIALAAEQAAKLTILGASLTLEILLRAANTLSVGIRGIEPRFPLSRLMPHFPHYVWRQATRSSQGLWLCCPGCHGTLLSLGLLSPSQ